MSNMNYKPEIDGRLYVIVLREDKSKFIIIEEFDLIKIYNFLLVRNRGYAKKFRALLNDVGNTYGVNNNLK